MKTVSMLDFRLDAERIIAQVQKGQRLILTRRGKSVARLEPIQDEIAQEDPFYSLADIGEPGVPAQPGDSLSNAQIDQAVYGQ